MSLSRTIRTYQQKCHAQYAGAIGLPKPYTYPDGNPIRPLPPVQTAVKGLMLAGDAFQLLIVSRARNGRNIDG
jgi:hypothetical protein